MDSYSEITPPPIAVTLPAWKGRPAAEGLAVANNAMSLGVREIWVGETNTYDAFAVGALVAERGANVTVIAGPLPVDVRSPASVAMGVAALSLAGDRPAGVSLGTSSPAIVQGWHGAKPQPALRSMREAVECIRTLLAGDRLDYDGGTVSSHGFRLREGVPRATIEIAAAGPKMLALAGSIGDGVTMNMVSPEQVEAMGRQAGLLPRDPAASFAPRIAVWVQAFLDPAREDIERFKEDLAIYVGAPGYRERFRQLGFDAVVDAAAEGPRLGQLARLIPDELIEAVGALGSAEEVRSRVAAYHASGADTVVIQPVTYGDTGGERVLRAVAAMALTQ